MIALVQAAPEFGAIERYLTDLVAALRERGEAAVVLYPDVPALEPLARTAGGSVLAEPFPNDVPTRFVPLGVAELLGRLRRLRPRLVHLNDPWPAALLAARLARVPRILVTHHTPELPRRDSLAGRFWWRLGWATGPEIIYTSESDRRTDARRRSRTHVVSYGIDLERFASARPALDGKGPVVGNVARLVEQKGQRFLVDAARIVLERHPETRFVLVGEGEARHDLEKRIAEAGLGERFLLTGERDDVPELLASFDVFALPSLFEGLCYAVVEAQAAGVPVVATPVGGVGENVVDEETGLVVPPGDAVALAAAISRLLEDVELARRLRAAARERVFERYSIDRMIEETIALYAEGRRG